MNYVEKIEKRGYTLRTEVIKNRYRRNLPKASNRQSFKIIIEARQLDIDLSDIVGQDKINYFLSLAEFKELEEELVEDDIYEKVMSWQEQAIPRLKPYMRPFIEHIGTWAIELHDMSPMIPQEQFGAEIGLTRHDVGFRLDKLVQDKWLRKIPTQKVRKDGRKHSNRYELVVPSILEISPVEEKQQKNHEAPAYDW